MKIMRVTSMQDMFISYGQQKNDVYFSSGNDSVYSNYIPRDFNRFGIVKLKGFGNLKGGVADLWLVRVRCRRRNS